MPRFLSALLLALAFSTPLFGQGDQVTDFPPDVRTWFLNTTNPGSCVQCSIGMCGVWQNVPAAATLLWDTEYGKREWHGSGPSRVEAYCDRRKIPVYNITGSNTWDWMKWASKTGRMSAIGAGSNHFQTLLYYDPVKGEWHVCNNNSPKRIDVYSEAGFRRLHLSSGQWVVILKAPPPPVLPVYVQWWR